MSYPTPTSTYSRRPLKVPAVDDDSSSRLRRPIHSERHVRVICIGAGASGLLLAYKLQKHFQNFSLIVYEKNAEVSGTWYENRYPGCACDIPSHSYTWSFEPKTDWSSVYAGSNEIFKYFNDFADKYGLRQYVRTNHQVVSANWNHRRDGYDIAVRSLDSNKVIHDRCDILINATGILNNWRWPDIPGLDKYKGALLHTANWDDNVQLEGKRVGLIGNGSSGIQVLPAIQPIVGHLTTFIRQPTWVVPFRGLEQNDYSQQERFEFASEPGKLLSHRKYLERGLNGQFGFFIKDTIINKTSHEETRSGMKKSIDDPYLEDKLIPNWSVGCRRITPGVGYLETLGEENVTVVCSGVNEVTERGCICDDGQEYPVDVLICATGFDANFKPRFPVVGPDGQNLQETWQDEPTSYFGIAAPEFPNYLMFLGPNSPVGNGPVLVAIESQADYMMKLIDRYQTENIRTFTPRTDAVEEFIEFKDQFMTKTIWSEPCRSWYKNHRPDGPITALWPGSTLHYIEAMRDMRMEDWDVAYKGNRYAWLGNGYSQTELDDTADWAYYIREEDDDEPLSRARRRKLLTNSGHVNNEGGSSFMAAKEKL